MVQSNPSRVSFYTSIEIALCLALFLSNIMLIRNYSSSKSESPVTTKSEVKFILLWTPVHLIFNKFEDEGLNIFVENDCEYTNCVITSKREMFADVRKFDAIVFSANSAKGNLPEVRSPHQKYIMASLEPPAFYSTRSYTQNATYSLNNYFNWTWTYRLDSDIQWRYFVIKNLNGREIGPKINTQWAEYFYSVSEEERMKLRKKTKAAAWIVSDCDTWSQREVYVRKLLCALRKHNLTLDLFGKCAGKLCESTANCARIFEKNYYFYIVFENAFDQDYVTEKLLMAINGLTVPVVLGGANYNRFLPPGSYLDARKHTPCRLADIISDIISKPSSYEQFFRWKNHYVYKNAVRSDICNLCKALNNATMVQNITVYKDMKEWWTEKKKNVDFEVNQRTLPPITTKNS